MINYFRNKCIYTSLTNSWKGSTQILTLNNRKNLCWENLKNQSFSTILNNPDESIKPEETDNGLYVLNFKDSQNIDKSWTTLDGKTSDTFEYTFNERLSTKMENKFIRRKSSFISHLK